MTNRTKIAHNGTTYKIINTITVEKAERNYPAVAEVFRRNGIVATHSVQRPNGRKVWMLDEFANGNTGNLQAI
jgi:hypothetical protein